MNDLRDGNDLMTLLTEFTHGHIVSDLGGGADVQLPIAIGHTAARFESALLTLVPVLS